MAVAPFRSDPAHLSVHPETDWIRLPSGVEITRLPIYDDHEGLFARLGHGPAAEWCRAHGWELPTVAEYDELHAIALHIDPYTLPTVEMIRAAGISERDTKAIDAYRNAHMMGREWCTQHDFEVWARLVRAGWDGERAVANAGKHWAQGKTIVGWWLAKGGRIQNPSTFHAGDPTYVDYATTFHAVRRALPTSVDGDASDLTDPEHTMQSATPAVHPHIQAPAKGPDVTRLQELLLGAGEALPHYGADGSMSAGGETETALRRAQGRLGLEQTGVADDATWEALGHAQRIPPAAPAQRMVPTVRTPITAEALADALHAAHVAVFGEAPSEHRLAIAWAQMWGETGDGRKSFNFNLGNVKATKGWPETMRLRDEHPDWQTNPSSVYKSYRDHAHGAEDYWRLLGRLYQNALVAMDTGDSNAAAVALQHGKAGAYFEAPLATYQLGLRLRVAEFRRLGLG